MVPPFALGYRFSILRRTKSRAGIVAQLRTHLPFTLASEYCRLRSGHRFIANQANSWKSRSHARSELDLPDNSCLSFSLCCIESTKAKLTPAQVARSNPVKFATMLPPSGGLHSRSLVFYSCRLQIGRVLDKVQNVQLNHSVRCVLTVGRGL